MDYTGERIEHQNCGTVYQIRQGRLTLIKLLNKIKSSLVDFLALSKLKFSSFSIISFFFFLALFKFFRGEEIHDFKIFIGGLAYLKTSFVAEITDHLSLKSDIANFQP